MAFLSFIYTNKNIDDIVFRYRNKQFGAYDLRQRYNKNLFISFSLSSIAVVGILFFIHFANQNSEPEIEPARFVEFQQFNLNELSVKLPNLPVVSEPAQPKSTEKPKTDKVEKTTIKETENITSKIIVTDTETKIDSSLTKTDSTLVKSDSTSTALKGDSVSGTSIKATGSVLVLEQTKMGGLQEFIMYVQKHFVYPESVKKQNLSGTVFVYFTISETGELKNTSIKRGFDKDCDKEILRVIEASPVWKPATENGIARVQTILVPIKIAPFKQ